MSRATSEWIAEQIRKTLGNKPIKYLIVSHFHNDHVAGVGYYADHGIQIVTTRSIAPILQRYAAVTSKLRSDIPPLGAPPAFLFVDDDHIDLKGTGGKQVSIYKLADFPHAKDMLVAYQPAGRPIVEADLYVELAPFSPASEFLAEWMDQQTALQIDRIIGTHLAEISRSDFERVRKDSGLNRAN